MRYIGNKTELLDFIEKPLIDNNITNGVFCDIFAGTTNVSKYFKKKNYNIISNDNMSYSYVFQKTYVENNLLTLKFSNLSDQISNPSLPKIIKYLNELHGIEGFIFKNFSKNHLNESIWQRNYFSVTNAKRIDALREKIEEWEEKGCLTEIEYYVLLCAIIERIPYVSNISGTYGAFLKINNPRMFKPFTIEVPKLIVNNSTNVCYNEDSNNLIKNIEMDILYIDPPYNHRQYPANYHIWESVSVWDKTITNTKTGLRDYEKQKSLFCSKTKCAQTFENLIKNAKSKYILFQL
ncbi:MAG: DNA adenine methylase [Candidatus Nitrosoabyssus spongiisocia]|nr:MAG: DNA adenine methylase [Nitrosopumilaceae archaeon AB1(1)]